MCSTRKCLNRKEIASRRDNVERWKVVTLSAQFVYRDARTVSHPSVPKCESRLLAQETWESKIQINRSTLADWDGKRGWTHRTGRGGESERDKEVRGGGLGITRKLSCDGFTNIIENNPQVFRGRNRSAGRGARTRSKDESKDRQMTSGRAIHVVNRRRERWFTKSSMPFAKDR